MQPVTAHPFKRIRWIGRRGRLTTSVVCLGLMLPGCGNVLYTVSASRASGKLEEARLAGAEKSTLYEYTLAQEHLNKAMSEASEADYGDAYELAQLANEYATQALNKARLRQRAPDPSTATRPAISDAQQEQK